MSEAQNQNSEPLSTAEAKGYFELGTAGLVDYFSSIISTQTDEELAALLYNFYKERLEDLQAERDALLERLSALEATVENAEFPSQDKFNARKSATIEQIKHDLEDFVEQIEYFKYELDSLPNTRAAGYAEYKTNAKEFLDLRQRILDNWEKTYTTNPLEVINDIDGTQIAITSDGRDLSQWANDIMDKSSAG